MAAGLTPPPAAPRRIAACVDADTAADRALGEAARLAALSGGRTLVVHASPDATDADRDWLAGVAAGVRGAEPVLLRDGGHAGDAIATWAEDEGVDLLVVAPHRGALSRLVLGSFATHLAERAACPVLIARGTGEGDAPAADAGPHRHIGCCMADDDASDHALAVARSLRALGEGRLTLVHAAGVPAVTGDDAPERLAQAAEEAGLPLVVLPGDPARSIADWAGAAAADLLVAAPYRGGLRRAVLGSAARRLAYRAPCPVLLVRPPG